MGPIACCVCIGVGSVPSCAVPHSARPGFSEDGSVVVAAAAATALRTHSVGRTRTKLDTNPLTGAVVACCAICVTHCSTQRTRPTPKAKGCKK
jgi:hypothetical protein